MSKAARAWAERSGDPAETPITTAWHHRWTRLAGGRTPRWPQERRTALPSSRRPRARLRAKDQECPRDPCRSSDHLTRLRPTGPGPRSRRCRAGPAAHARRASGCTTPTTTSTSPTRSTAPLPRPGPDAPDRHRGDRAAAPGRARHLGRAARPGGGAGRLAAGRCAPQDFAFPTYREHGVAWCRGVDPLTLLGLFRGATTAAGTRTRTASTSTRSSSARRRCTPPATRWASRRTARSATRDGEATIAYFGDGASSQGDVNEAFVWAGAYTAPIVFFCQNNQWAISDPDATQTRIPLYHRAAGFGFPACGSTATTCSPRTR